MTRILVITLVALLSHFRGHSQIQSTLCWETPPQAYYMVYMKSSMAYTLLSAQIPTTQVTGVALHSVATSKFTVIGLTSYEPSIICSHFLSPPTFTEGG